MSGILNRNYLCALHFLIFCYFDILCQKFNMNVEFIFWSSQYYFFSLNITTTPHFLRSRKKMHHPRRKFRHRAVIAKVIKKTSQRLLLPLHLSHQLRQQMGTAACWIRCSSQMPRLPLGLLSGKRNGAPNCVSVISVRWVSHWALSIWRPGIFPGIGISVIKIRWSLDRLIFIMGIPAQVRWHLCIEMFIR